MKNKASKSKLVQQRGGMSQTVQQELLKDITMQLFLERKVSTPAEVIKYSWEKASRAKGLQVRLFVGLWFGMQISEEAPHGGK